MRVHDAMTIEVQTISPATTVRDAARVMADQDIGALPVVEGKRIVGMLTDRDIAVRAAAVALGSDTPVSEIMTRDVQCCQSVEELDHALDEMGEQKVRRMPVLSKEGEMVGMLSLADIVCIDDDFRSIGRALRDICTPHGVHSQAARTRPDID
ncbi:CBS domain-containing protein [Sphingobium baderi]|nr:CBS domain-containing protein [Sphingobium baderi]KMS58988.1 inosine-5'-monophosphate dehydrogenase [Sphingobium baderi LL03]